MPPRKAKTAKRSSAKGGKQAATKKSSIVDTPPPVAAAQLHPDAALREMEHTATPTLLMFPSDDAGLSQCAPNAGSDDATLPRSSPYHLQVGVASSRARRSNAWASEMDRFVFSTTVVAHEEVSDASDDDCPTPRWNPKRPSLSKWETELRFDD